MHQNGRRTFRLAPKPGRRVLSLLVVLSVLLPALPVFTASVPVNAATAALIQLPFASGANWSVLQGYNTSPTDQYGGSHYNCDPATLTDTPSHTQTCGAQYQYKYSLDLVRADGLTSGQPVYAPVSGTVRWRDDSTGGLSINMGNGYAFAFFHVNVNSNLTAGVGITQGQLLGTIAPPGSANNGGTAHIHVTLWQTNDGGNWNRVAIPFTGTFALDGYDLPAKADSVHNQYVGMTLVSSNTTPAATQTPSAAAAPAAPVLTSPSNGTTYQTAGITVTFTWKAAAGAAQYQLQLGDTATSWLSTTSWTSGTLTDTGQYAWKVRARDASGNIGAWSPAIVFWIDPANGAGCSTTGTPTPGSLSLVLDSSSEVVTDCVTLTGKGFGANEKVNIYIDNPSGTPFDTVTAAANGSFYDSVLIPDIAGGAHTFYAKGVSSSRQATASFRVSPTIRRDPFSGSVGDNLLITGRGFGANEQVNVTFYLDDSDSTSVSLGSFTTNAQGLGTLSTQFPAASNGLHDYNGQGVTSGLLAWGAMQIYRSVAVSPSGGKPGAVIALAATGFPASASVTATWNTASGQTLCSGTTSSVGNFNCSMTIPASALAGSYPVLLTTTGGTSSSALVNVSGSPAISTSISGGQSGAKITIAGGGFQANSNVTLTWSGADWVTIGTNSGGGFSYPTTIPQGFIGNHTLGARGTSPGGSSIWPTTIVRVSSTGGDTGSRMTSYGTFAVTATIEGLVGQGTSNGHTITPLDHFVSLPSCTGTSCPGWSTGPATACGNACYVRVTNPATGICSVAPVYDVGPWFTNDNWWDPAADRKLNALASNPSYLVQGYPAAEATLDGLDVGYGPGVSNVGYQTGNRAAIDIADGTWVDIGIDQNAGIAPIVVTMLWMTGENYQTAMAACGQAVGNPTITPTATGGIKVGNSLTINGTGFKANETVSIRLDSANAAVLGSATAGNNGVVAVTITVPAATFGTHTLYATGSAGSAATAKIAITQSINAPATANVGQPITVTGTGFAANESVAIRWGSTTAPIAGTATTNAIGSFTTQAILGSATNGPHYLYATATSGKPWVKVSILPNVTLSATSGPSYQKVTVSATGFAAGELVSFAWSGSSSAGSGYADSRGSVSFPVRTRRGAGTATGTATGTTSGLTATASYTVIPGIWLSPTSGGPGTTIKVSGNGWNATATVTVKFNGATTFCTTKTTTSGDFNCAGTIPNGTAAGSYPITVASNALTATAQLGVVGASAASVSAVSAPAAAKVGVPITVTGTGFASGEQVALRWGSATSPLVGNAVANAAGAFTTQAVLTGAANGPHALFATATSGKASVKVSILPDVKLSSASGDSYQLITVVASGFKAGEQVSFAWNGSAAAGSATADAKGSASFAVRTRQGAGTEIGTAKGLSSGLTATASYTVIPNLTAAPASGAQGAKIAVSGTGWNGNAAVTVTFKSAAFCATTTNSVGAFNCSGTIPANAALGAGALTATSNALTAAATFTVSGVKSAAQAGTPSPTTTPASTSATTTATTDASPVAASPVAETTETPTPVQPAKTATAEPPTETPTDVPPTETSTEVPPTETPTPPPTETPTPKPQTSVINPIAAANVANPASEATPTVPIDPNIELLAGGPLNAVAAISFDVESIGSGKLISATLTLTGGADGSGASTIVAALPGYVVDPTVTDRASIPVDQAVQVVSDGGVPAQYVSNPGVESALDVTHAVTGDGVVTFFISGPPDQILAIAGRASGAPPRLQLVVQPAN